MKLTQNWIKKQIADYSKMIMDLTGEPRDTKLRTIWSERVNTLESVLIVLELEMKTDSNFYTDQYGVLIDKRGE